MEEENPLEKIADEIAKILQFLHEHEKTPLSPTIEKDLVDKLAVLEQQFAIYEAVNDRAFELAGGADIIQTKTMDQIDPRQRKFLERLAAMQKDLTQMQMGVKRALDKVKKEEEKDKKAAKANKKKFKRIGGDNKWIPL